MNRTFAAFLAVLGVLALGALLYWILHNRSGSGSEPTVIPGSENDQHVDSNRIKKQSDTTENDKFTKQYEYSDKLHEVIKYHIVSGGSSDLAYVTGYIGNDPSTNIPHVPLIGHSYFITNLPQVYEMAIENGWSACLVKIDGQMKDDNARSAASKHLKVFPQKYIQSITSRNDYRFVTWFDNKFNVNAKGTRATIDSWRPHHALMLHQHPFLCGSNNIYCGADEELEASLNQPRYAMEADRYRIYMKEEAEKGYPSHGERHFQTGYLLYNMAHEDCSTIQNMWSSHIQRCGIQCQISMYYVAQRFPRSIGEYVESIEED